MVPPQPKQVQYPIISSNAEGVCQGLNHFPLSSSPHPSGTGPRWTAPPDLPSGRRVFSWSFPSLCLQPGPLPRASPLPRLWEHVQSPSCCSSWTEGKACRCRDPEGHSHSPWGPWEWEKFLGVSACALLFTEREERAGHSFPTPSHQSCPLRPASAGQCRLHCTSALFLRVIARDQERQMFTLWPVPGRGEGKQQCHGS